MSKTIKLGDKANVIMDGRFKLKVLVDPKKFRLTNINSFVPYGKTVKDRIQFMTENGPVDSLLIGQVSIVFDPSRSDVERHNVEALIQHPEVRILGMPKEEYQELVRLNLKKANPKFTIVNVDRVKTIEFDKETELIEARYLLRNKKNPLSKDKLIFLCSRFGLSYRSKTEDPARYKIELINKLDKFISTENVFENGKTNLQVFVECIDDIKNTEMYFYISELIKMDIISDMGGVYKIGIRPVGPNKNSIIDYYESNPELFKEHKKLVLENLQGVLNV